MMKNGCFQTENVVRSKFVGCAKAFVNNRDNI